MTSLIIYSPITAILLALIGYRWLQPKIISLITIVGVLVSFIASCVIFYSLAQSNEVMNITFYVWGQLAHTKLSIGLLLDRLTAIMLMVVTFISLMVHIYSVIYMHKDPGMKRFFCYITLFTIAMIMLVTANNFLQLFFGWEAVGLVSYLLIGFWYNKETAISANLKAFLINRVADFGFVIGISIIFFYVGSLDYSVVFNKAEVLSASKIQLLPNVQLPAITVACFCLLVGAMGKSAQMPLHVWLPDSMEGPTPISALIHAATMVTAGIFLIARLSPLFELAESILSLVLIIGALTCVSMGLVAVVQNDIKRIIAFSTLSQLGIMFSALGASAYDAAIFHLVTHAFFKALLFLGAGSVILSLHHEQDIRNMGNLYKALPITSKVMIIGTLAITGFPGLSGFYSKDLIIEALDISYIYGSGFAYMAVLSSVYITSLYSFRLLFKVFFANNQNDLSGVKESCAILWVPLILLAIPSIMSGAIFMPKLLNDFFGNTTHVIASHDVLSQFVEHRYHGVVAMFLHGFYATPFWLSLLGAITAWVLCVQKNSHFISMLNKLTLIREILIKQFGFDWFYQRIIVPFVKFIGQICWRIGDAWMVDGVMVNGSAISVSIFSKLLRKIQTGYIYHYALIIITGFVALMVWVLIYE